MHKICSKILKDLCHRNRFSTWSDGLKKSSFTLTYARHPSEKTPNRGFSASNRAKKNVKILDQDVALFTEDEDSLPLVEAILDSPIQIEEWNDIPAKQRKILKGISCHFDPSKLPSISSVLAKTKTPLSELILSRWIKKTKKELGEVGYTDHMTKLRNDGISFHSLVQNFLQGSPPTDPEILESGLWKSVLPVLNELEEIHCVEKEVFHPMLWYSGRLDCVAMYKNKICVFDWKSSQKRKDSLAKCYDDPFQVAAYAGAVNVLGDASTQVTNAVIVKAYPDGTPADVHFINEFAFDFYWNAWLRRLAQHHVQVVTAAKK